MFELGVYTFGDLPRGTGGAESAKQRLDEIVAAAKLADELGLSAFGVGEHHRSDFAVSSPAVVLGALANATKNIKLTTAVTILSSADPVRVFEDFATVDLLSAGRAELIIGRGAFVESFPLFGYQLDDYNELYDEKLELLLKIRDQDPVSWQGKFRSALHDAEISPRPLAGDNKFWIGAGGTPESAIRAGKLGLPLNLANIGGEPARFKPFIDLYRRTAVESGFAPEALRIGVSSHLHINQNSQQALREFYPHYSTYIGNNLPNRNRGWQVNPDDYARLASPTGALFVGSPQQIVDKILYEHELFGHHRFMAQVDVGGLPFEKVANTLELLGTQVLPAVRKALGQS
jgi:probable LLM family oxidoreductase